MKIWFATAAAWTSISQTSRNACSDIDVAPVAIADVFDGCNFAFLVRVFQGFVKGNLVPLDRLDPADFDPAATVPDEILKDLSRYGKHLYEDTGYAILGWGAGVCFMGLSLEEPFSIPDKNELGCGPDEVPVIWPEITGTPQYSVKGEWRCVKLGNCECEAFEAAPDKYPFCRFEPNIYWAFLNINLEQLDGVNKWPGFKEEYDTKYPIIDTILTQFPGYKCCNQEAGYRLNRRGECVRRGN